MKPVYLEVRDHWDTDKNMRNWLIFNRGIWLGTLWLWRFLLSPLAVSWVYFWSTKPWGQREGLPEKWEVKHGFGRIYPTPQWVCDCVHAYTCECVGWLFYCCNRSRWNGKPCRSHLDTYQIELKFPSLFFHFSPWSKLAEEASWFVSVNSLLMYLWYPI